MRSQWKNWFSFLMVACGTAIGLGNIWKFPYITGVYGGSAFIFVYLLCLILIGVPMLFAEIYLGQKAQSHALLAFKKFSHSKWVQLIPQIGLLGALSVITYYSVVGGWVVEFCMHALLGTLEPSTTVSTDLKQVPYHLAFVACVYFVTSKKLEAGVEKFNLITMPLLFGLLILLCIYAFTSLSGFWPALNFLFTPNFELVNARVFVEAIAHSFFTLGVGVLAHLTYGSYLNSEQKIHKTVFWIALLDTVCALLCGIVIFSIVFSFSGDVSQGPTLIFVTLPALFKSLPMGNLVAALFFVLVFFAAISSAFAMVEPIISWLEVKWGSRKKATLGLMILVYLIGLLIILNNAGYFLSPGQIFNALDALTTKVFMPIVAIGISLFVGWKLDKNWKKDYQNHSFILAFLSYSLRIISPLGILLVFLAALFN